VNADGGDSAAKNSLVYSASEYDWNRLLKDHKSSSIALMGLVMYQQTMKRENLP